MKESLSSQIKNERKIECSFPVPALKVASGCFTTTFHTESHSLAQIRGKRSIPLEYVYIIHTQSWFSHPSALATRMVWYTCSQQAEGGTGGLRHPMALAPRGCTAPLLERACMQRVGVCPCTSPFLGTDAPSVSYKATWIGANLS